jgi:hypothetical protein
MIQKNSIVTTKHISNFSNAMEVMKRELSRARVAGELEVMERVQKEISKLEREMAISKEQYAKR